MSTPHVEGYVIVEKIGAGSYSTVYKAFKKDGCREAVAIKVVEKKRLSKSAEDNIVTEISLLKKLKHPHIVNMKDFLYDGRCIYIIMEWCGGGDLSGFIKKRRCLPEPVCRRFLQQLSAALKYLRSHNVCHMDLKPSNLLLGQQQVLKIGDFGFAQYLSDEDKHNAIRGSPLYMAPEMLLAGKYDARVDLWSVGVIMYECLFGKAPYSSNSFQELSDKIRQKAPIDVPKCASVSAQCRDLLTRLLKHDPEQRIDFETFFKHSYLDLEHFPSEESLQKAIDLVSKAVKLDAEHKEREAFNLYCEALLYFVPLLNAEMDPTKKTALRVKVDEYIKRAEELKDPASARSPSNDSSFSQLLKMCTTSEKMCTALEIGHTGEMYMTEGQYNLALGKFESCLAALMPLLAQEPRGPRRDLLHKQVQHWLLLAESSKSLAALPTLKERSTLSTTSVKEMCLLQ
ncbi:Serine/threonine-protein kinase ULK3 [Frankliniella fusca]|uniref:Serine/threonine-protein kinase ULK3 n=1 Tax=Frankliniella fusca TaxID=407009 RepID=A0AAE1GXG4_9NEOP|nr:Serine/threonine-protein kinase ULK3 [Frankliniella fusca]